MSAAPSFRVHGNRRLRRAGAAGREVRLTLDGRCLSLAGEGPPVRWPIASIERMRTGFTEGKGGPFCHTILWVAGGKPITLAPMREDLHAYGTFVHALAAALAASHGLRAVERGDTVFGAVFSVVLMGLLFAAAVAVCVIALADQPVPLRWLPALIPGLIFALLLWRFQTLHRPRPVTKLDELRAQLPF